MAGGGGGAKGDTWDVQYVLELVGVVGTCGENSLRGGGQDLGPSAQVRPGR